ncbi:MAG: hypothetical protein FWF76_03250 [Oscillospiraceae bacterium]|nr:hypothetical protein [Oscillospiraceae bacterium]
MAQIDTRYNEKNKLMAFLTAKHTGDIDSQIALTRASMEREDIEDVMKEFENWKANFEKGDTLC